MSDRRFTDKPDLHPEAVRSLPPDHAALTENRTPSDGYGAKMHMLNSTPTARAVLSRRRKEWWQKLSPEERSAFIAMTKDAQRSDEARTTASERKKMHWQDPLIREKYLAANRAKGAAKKGKPLSINHRNKLREYYSDPEKRAARSEQARQAHAAGKYRKQQSSEHVRKRVEATRLTKARQGGDCNSGVNTQ